MANEDKKDFNAMLHDSKDMPKFQTITDQKSIEKYGGSRMYFAPPIDYDKVMKLIPYGKVITVGKIREYFAELNGADFTEPITAGIFVSIAAWASYQRSEDETPYWRTLKANGELNAKYPGGIEAQKERLEAEGHTIIQKGRTNMHDFDTSMFFRWIFKSAFAILIVSNTWNIVMGVFDATQSVVNQSSGVIIGETSIHFDRLIPGLEFQLESMTIGSLLSLWFQTLVVGLTMNILSICIFLVTYGRMIEIYVVTALGPIPLATMGSSEWRSTGQNYLKSLLALGFQAFLIMIVVGIYAVLIRNISGAADIAGAIWGCMGYTVLLCFCLFKTGSISKSVFGAH